MISEKITGMIMEATKNKETVRASVYKLIKNEFLKFKTAKNAKPLDEAAEIGILLKMVKQREESISQYKAGNRLDLANAEQAEIDILQEMLPKIPTKEDVQDWILNNYPEGVQKANMGFVIREIKMTLAGVDGKIVADCVKNVLV